jgi:hypothetical protein
MLLSFEFHLLILFNYCTLCVSVCVCVCEREREIFVFNLRLCSTGPNCKLSMNLVSLLYVI